MLGYDDIEWPTEQEYEDYLESHQFVKDMEEAAEAYDDTIVSIPEEYYETHIDVVVDNSPYI